MMLAMWPKDIATLYNGWKFDGRHLHDPHGRSLGPDADLTTGQFAEMHGYAKSGIRHIINQRFLPFRMGQDPYQSRFQDVLLINASLAVSRTMARKDGKCL